MTDESNHDAFNPKVILRIYDNRLHLGIGRMQLNPVPFGHVFLNGRFVVHQGHHGLTILRSGLLANDDKIPRVDAVVSHRLPFDFQREGFAPAQQAGRDINEFKLGHRFNGFTCSHDAEQWEPWWIHQLPQRHCDHKGNGAAPVFIADDRPPRAPEFFRQLLLTEPYRLSRSSELIGTHVTNCHIPPTVLSSPSNQRYSSFVKRPNSGTRHASQGYRLTDCLSMTMMRARRIMHVLTTDHHFEQEGFTLLMAGGRRG